MPELPEVETVVRGLRNSIIGSTITSAKISDKKLRIPYPEFNEIIDDKIESIERRSKYIIINLNSKKRLIVHLGMSGKLLVGKNMEPLKHDHVRLCLNDNREMVYNDPRRFGLIAILNDNELESHKLFANLGIEPLTDEFDGKYLQNIFKGKNAPIKSSIMDASLIVGVGNIYACESLFRTGIHPLKPSGSLKKSQADELVKNIKIVLEEAIESGGSTLRDYVRSDGDVGYFQHKFSVYGRKDEECYECSTKIENVKIAGRSSFFCTKCQSAL